jgi:hypothetical protein
MHEVFARGSHNLNLAGYKAATTSLIKGDAMCHHHMAMLLCPLLASLQANATCHHPPWEDHL